MKSTLLALAGACAVSAALTAGSDPTIKGDYVEVRTNEVFAGGCIVGMEGENSGNQALLAWRVTEGSLNGVRLAGLSVMAAIVGDRNLGNRDLGGGAPRNIRADVYVDERATPAQRDALVALVRKSTSTLDPAVLRVTASPIAFGGDAHRIEVATENAAFRVVKHLDHDPSCGAAVWFDPLVPHLQEPTVGITETQHYRGTLLGTKWEQSDRKSAYFGRFAY
jgi:hypothetical protein